MVTAVLMASVPLLARTKKEHPLPNEEGPPGLVLDGGRRLDYVQSFSSEAEIRPKKPWWSRIIDFVAGPPDVHRMVRPYGVAVDSHGRYIVSDPGLRVVHIFDFGRQKYQRLEGSGREDFNSPIGIAVDDRDNIYVADSEIGKVFVFRSSGKFSHYIGDIKGEGYFKRPTGLAIDPKRQHLYITDTLRNSIYIADLQGTISKHFGGSGSGPGEFNFPTDLALHDDILYVVDAMNFRVQGFDVAGHFQSQFGRLGAVSGNMFRSKGIAVDSEGDIYVADAFLDTVQVFNPQGVLLYFFGRLGTGAAEFQLPAGVAIARDQVSVVDSANRRVQVFRYTPSVVPTSGGMQ